MNFSSLSSFFQGQGLVAGVKGGDIGRNQERSLIYERNWEFYRNVAFENLGRWAAYIYEKDLYSHTRLIYNPVKRMVNFYAGNVYPGRLSVDGKNLPYTVRNAIPFSRRTDARLIEAVAQIWEWSNWQQKMKLMVRYAANAGNCLVEIVDDVPGGKVRLEVIWTQMVRDFELDGYGNLVWYELEYQATEKSPEGDEETYLFRKLVTKEEVTTFKNDEQVSKVALPYGFIPACWVKHKDLGGDFGVDAFDGDYIKTEELNSLATHGLDNLHKNIDPVLLIFADSAISNAMQQMETAVSAGQYDERRQYKYLKAGKDGKVESMVGQLVTRELLDYIKSLTAEIEESNPELQFYHILRDKQYVSGPGARAMIGDAEANHDEASGTYDMYSKKLFQMAVAIGGHRLKEGAGGWSEKTAHQMKFDGWDLDSYKKDDIGMEIMARPLLPWTIDDEAAMMQTRFTAVAQAVPFFPLEKLMELAGIEEADERKQLKKDLLSEMKVKSEAEKGPGPTGGPEGNGKPQPTKKKAGEGSEGVGKTK